MSLGIRGANPIWNEVDLQGNLFDDTFYLFVLENTIPYMPAKVYHDPDLNTEWTNPIQFLGNGTLPNDIYFESDVVYRLEFRQGPTQAYPLIYEVNNYVAGSGGSTPVDSLAFASSNQVTNPQFALINFSSPTTISGTDPDPIDVAPGWVLELAGTGTVTLTQVPLNESNTNPSNAPYALRLTLNGWTNDSVILRQRFEQNGMLWANKIVSTTVTARLDGSPQEITATLVDSNDSLLATVLNSTSVNELWNEFKGYGDLPETTNPDDPPSAYIDYRLLLPSNIDIYLSSFQLVVQDLPIEPAFEQDSIERQIDHTFHYYQPQINFKPTTNVLTAWDFPLNPAQFGGTSQTLSANAATGNAAYVWDQTICGRVASNYNIIRNASTDGIQFTATGNNSAFFMMQYLTLDQVKPLMQSKLSVNVLCRRNVVGLSTMRVYLYRAPNSSSIPTLPTGLGTLNAAGVFTLTASGWTEVPRGVKGEAVTAIGTTLNTDYQFNEWQVVDDAEITDTDHFAVVVTFTTPTTNTSIAVDSLNLCIGNIPCRPSAEMPADVLQECQYYYEKTYNSSVAPNTLSTTGAILMPTFYDITASTIGYIGSFGLPYVTKRLPIEVTGPTKNMTFYSPQFSGTDYVSVRLFKDGSALVAGVTAGAGVTLTPAGSGNGYFAFASYLSLDNATNQRGTFLSTNTSTAVITAVGNPNGEVFMQFHYVIDQRLGVV